MARRSETSSWLFSMARSVKTCR